MKRPIFYALLWSALVACAASAEPSDLDLALQLDREEATLKQMRERLILAESQSLQAAPLREELRRQLAGRPADSLVSSVVMENLRVERTNAEADGLTYTVICSNITAFEIMEALQKTSGLELELHPQTRRESLLGRLTLHMENVDFIDLLQIVCGTQGLGVTVGSGKILVAPMPALTSAPVEDILRELAMEANQTALLRYPESDHAAAAYLGIARYYAKTGFHEAAAQAAQTILNRYPHSDVRGDAHIFLGDCLSALKQFESARAAYYRYIDNNPGRAQVVDALMNIGKSWMDEGNWVQAGAVYEEVFEQWPESDQAPFARLYLARCKGNEGHYEQALDQLRLIEKSFAQLPQRYEIQAFAADCLLRLKRYAQARVYLKQVAEQAKDVRIAEEACYSLGDSFLMEENGLEALEAYKAAVRAFPRGRLKDAAPIRLARAYMRLGLYAKAEEELRNLPPQLQTTLAIRQMIITLAEYYSGIGDSERTLRLLQSLPDADSAADVQLVKAKNYLNAGYPDKALERANAAYKLAKADAGRNKALELIGAAHLAKGQPIMAAMAFGGKNP